MRSAVPKSTARVCLQERLTAPARPRMTTGQHNHKPNQLNMPKEKSKPRPSSDSASSPSELGTKIIHYVQAGYSGAPVFLKNDGTEEWYFAGIVSQGVPGENYFFVVKPSFLLHEIYPDFK